MPERVQRSYGLDPLETMRDAEGIGLAAIQVGRPVCMLVADVGARGPAGVPKVFINPLILDTERESVFDEGCLSVSGVSAEITRPEAILLRYTNGRGKEREDRFNDLLTRVLQHEIDLLDGKLFVDYVSPLRRARPCGRCGLC